MLNNKNYSKEKNICIKNNKGISLIMLIVAILMMLIIVTLAVFYSRNTTPEAKFASDYYSLTSVKNACEDAKMLIEINPNKYDEYYFFGNNIYNKKSGDVLLTDADRSNIAKECGLDETYEFNDETYVIYPAISEEDERILENLELKGITKTYIVDLQNTEYYVLGGIKHSSGDKVYEYKDVVSSYEMLVEDTK